MKKIFLKILLLIFFGAALLGSQDVQAADTSICDVQITFTSKGNPVFNDKFYIMNLQKAYNKIKKGTITSEDVNSAAWQKVEQQRGVFVKDTFGIDFGVKHSADDTESILRNLYNSGASNLVDQLNGHKETTQLHFPENISRRYTDNNGKAEGTTEAGINGVFDADGDLVQLIRVKKGSSNDFTIDINSTTALFKGEITNLSNAVKANTNSFTVEFGQEVAYQLTIDKSLLAQDLPLVINPQANVVIDDISIPYTQVAAHGDTINLQSLGLTTDNSISATASLTVLKSQIQTKFYNNTLWGYAMTVPQSDSDVTITIKAHLAPEVKIKADLQGVTTNGEITPMEFTVGASDLSAKTNFFMNLVAMTSTGPLEYSMPTLRTSGINFASVNLNGSRLENKNSYFLGYEKDNQKYIYGQNQWNLVSNLENIDPTTMQVFSGGNQYYLGGASIPIPVNTNLFSFNAEKNRKINESLIKFIGLGQGKKYFLYPLEEVEGERKEIPFTVYNKDHLRSNGQRITSTSIGNAQYGDYKINGLIPDFQAGSTEYNVVMPQHNLFNPRIIVFSELCGIVILIIGFLFFFVRKGK